MQIPVHYISGDGSLTDLFAQSSRRGIFLCDQEIFIADLLQDIRIEPCSRRIRFQIRQIILCRISFGTVVVQVYIFVQVFLQGIQRQGIRICRLHCRRIGSDISLYRAFQRIYTYIPPIGIALTCDCRRHIVIRHLQQSQCQFRQHFIALGAVLGIKIIIHDHRHSGCSGSDPAVVHAKCQLCNHGCRRDHIGRLCPVISLTGKIEQIHICQINSTIRILRCNGSICQISQFLQGKCCHFDLQCIDIVSGGCTTLITTGTGQIQDIFLEPFFVVETAVIGNSLRSILSVIPYKIIAVGGVKARFPLVSNLKGTRCHHSVAAGLILTIGIDQTVITVFVTYCHCRYIIVAVIICCEIHKIGTGYGLKCICLRNIIPFCQKLCAIRLCMIQDVEILGNISGRIGCYRISSGCRACLHNSTCIISGYPPGRSL